MALKDHAALQARGVDLAAVHEHMAFAGLLQARQGVEDGGLAAP